MRRFCVLMLMFLVTACSVKTEVKQPVDERTIMERFIENTDVFDSKTMTEPEKSGKDVKVTIDNRKLVFFGGGSGVSSTGEPSYSQSIGKYPSFDNQMVKIYRKDILTLENAADETLEYIKKIGLINNVNECTTDEESYVKGEEYCSVRVVSEGQSVHWVEATIKKDGDEVYLMLGADRRLYVLITSSSFANLKKMPTASEEALSLLKTTKFTSFVNPVDYNISIDSRVDGSVLNRGDSVFFELNHKKFNDVGTISFNYDSSQTRAEINFPAPRTLYAIVPALSYEEAVAGTYTDRILLTYFKPLFVEDYLKEGEPLSIIGSNPGEYENLSGEFVIPSYELYINTDKMNSDLYPTSCPMGDCFGFMRLQVPAIAQEYLTILP